MTRVDLTLKTPEIELNRKLCAQTDGEMLRQASSTHNATRCKRTNRKEKETKEKKGKNTQELMLELVSAVSAWEAMREAKEKAAARQMKRNFALAAHASLQEVE